MDFFNADTVWKSPDEHNFQRLHEIRKMCGYKPQSVLLGTQRDGQPVFVDYSSLDRFLGLFIGRQGSGKSVFTAWLSYYFWLMNDCSVLLFDAADEYKHHREPLKDKDGLKRLNALGLRPTGYNDNLIRVKPRGLLTENDSTDYSFSLTLNDIKEFGTENYEFLLGAAMNSQNTPAQQNAIGYLASQDCPDVSALLNAWKVFKEQMKKEGEGGSVAHITKMFYNLESYNVFGKQENKFPFLDALNDQILLCLLGNPDGSTTSSRVYSFYASYLATAIYYWKMNGKLTRPVLTCRDELSGFVSFPEGQAVVRREYNFQRKAGNHAFQATQFLNLIPDELLIQMLGTGIIIGNKMPFRFIEKIAQAKMIDAEKLNYICEGLDETKRPSELFVIDQRGEIQTFYPATPPTQYLMPKKIEEW